MASTLVERAYEQAHETRDDYIAANNLTFYDRDVVILDSNGNLAPAEGNASRAVGVAWRDRRSSFTADSDNETNAQETVLYVPRDEKILYRMKVDDAGNTVNIGDRYNLERPSEDQVVDLSAGSKANGPVRVYATSREESQLASDEVLVTLP